jgi:hypothetical protein
MIAAKIVIKLYFQAGTSGNAKDPFGFGIGSRKCMKPAYPYRYFGLCYQPI